MVFFMSFCNIYSHYLPITDNTAKAEYFFIKNLLILYFKNLSLHSEKRGTFRHFIPKPK